MRYGILSRIERRDWSHGSRLLAVPFDAERLEVRGEAVTVAEGVAAEVGRGGAQFGVSRAGSLAFARGELDDLANVVPDGKRFLVTRKIPMKPITRIVVALGGTSEIGKGAP